MVSIERWSTWKRLGVWPFEGDGAEQPAYVIEEFDLIEAVLEELRGEDRKRAEDEQRRKEAEAKRKRKG